MPTTPHILIVGAGAVGLVYGRHSQLGGCRVTYYVREKYRTEAEAGYPMYPLNTLSTKRGDKPVLFAEFDVVTSPEQIADAGPFDQVWLCVSSPALRGGWLAPILQSAGDDATLILLTNGLSDQELVAEMTGDAATGEPRIVQGIISMISYQGPLPNETLPEPGCVYWFPPLGPSPFSGQKARVQAVVGQLKEGGCPAKVHPDVSAVVGFPTATLMPFLLAMEGAGWTFAGMKSGDWLQRCTEASREARATVSARTGHKEPMQMKLLSPTVLRMAMALAPTVIPLPIEAFLAYHFTKVGDQTRMYVDDYIKIAEQRGLPADNLRELNNRLPPPAKELAKPAASTASAT